MVTDEMRMVRVPGWNRFEWMRHGFSTRVGGVSSVYGPAELNLGFTLDDDPAKVRENRRLCLETVAATDQSFSLVTVRQVHGTRIKVVETCAPDLATEDGRATIEADGLMTAAPAMMLGIQAADCVPVLVADVRRRVVAAFHAGWRGTVAGIVKQGIAQIGVGIASDPEDLIAAVGPSIGSCCYAVGDEVRDAFHQAFPYAADLFIQRDGALYLDLQEANRRQLHAAGLAPQAITVIGECTGCTCFPDGRRKYFSHRIDRGITGRAMGMIGIVD
jgi:YfiH family protein